MAVTYPVLLPMPLGGTLDYLAAEDMALAAGESRTESGAASGRVSRLAPGTLVEVPLGQRKAVGVIWDRPLGPQKPVPLDRLKPVSSVLALPPLPGDLMQLVRFVADYTLNDPGRVLRMALSPSEVLDTPPLRTVVTRGGSGAEDLAEGGPGVRVTPARQQVLDAYTDGLTVAELAARAGVSDAVIRTMIAKAMLGSVSVSRDAPFPAVTPQAGPALNTEQQAATRDLVAAVKAQSFDPVLLDGVTGSGKTEVYFEAIGAAVAFGQQVLVLVPEIGLTQQWLDRFEARFGVRPAEWHSDIGTAQKRRVWQALSAGGAQVVVGARSALFLPFQALGLIIVDEEHDPSFRQEDGVLYHARDMAVMRAKHAHAVVVLSSATPSLETRINVERGRYRVLELRQRFGGAVLPDIQAVDMRRESLTADRWLSEPLKAAVTASLARGEQSLLFLNRRGYAPLTLCRTCGHRFQCSDCTAWLVEHRFRRELHCHQCGAVQPLPDACPSCGDADSLAACGPGVERLFEEVVAAFPDASTVVMTSDTLASPKETRRIIQAIEAGVVDIIIGTQLITKGYHFEALTCVGIVDADLGLKGGDLRAGERTYQQLVQVAGRAGRGDRRGTVYLQTYEPENPVMQAIVAGDGARFYQLEREGRESFHMPPFGRLAALVLSGEDEAAVMDQGRLLARSAPTGHGLEVFGPAPAPLARLRGRFRVRMLVHGHSTARIQPVISAWLARTRMIKGVRVVADIDPYSFL